MSHIVSDPNGRFKLAVIHEEMTKDKVKVIKRKARQAQWMAVSTILSSVSALGSGSLASFEARIANARISGLMAGMYSRNIEAELVLGIEIQVSNTNDCEMMVADVERGLVWYVLPGHTCTLQLNNPDAAILRISDAKNTDNSICYATLTGGSSITKEEIVYEDDDYLVVKHIEDIDNIYSSFKPSEYYCIDKDDYTETPYSFNQLKELKEKRR